MSLDRRTINNIISELIANRKIPAIKELRGATGLGLKESKDVIDNMYVVIPNRVEMERRLTMHPNVTGHNFNTYVPPFDGEYAQQQTAPNPVVTLLEENNNLLRDLIDVVSELTAAITEKD